jgi:ubiquinone/menaquinone biosynthesis C-methylase UbiE
VKADLQFSDASFDLVVSSLAIHNLPGSDAWLSTIDEAIRVKKRTHSTGSNMNCVSTPTTTGTSTRSACRKTN